jgi:hypothetical protein
MRQVQEDRPVGLAGLPVPGEIRPVGLAPDVGRDHLHFPLGERRLAGLGVVGGERGPDHAA